MNYPDVLDALEKTPRNWWLMSGGQIRCWIIVGKAMACPVSVLAPAATRNFYDVARTVGLSARWADLIAAAADNDEHHDASIRADLLRACGLLPQLEPLKG